jgi:TolA protein
MVTRNNAAEISKAKAKARAAAEARAAREAAAEQQRIASAFTGAVSSLSGNFSGATSVELKGPGGGGVPYGNWKAGVRRVYMEAWVIPDGAEEVQVVASITVARNGEVTSTSIKRLSGNALVNQSVRAVLDRVRYVPPLPEDSKDDHRDIELTFDVKAKQGLG